MSSPVGTFKLASVLLQYPAGELLGSLDAVDAAVGALPARAERVPLARLARWLRATPPTESAAHYVEVFDLRRRASLYLTYFEHGDTRDRGIALLACKEAYRGLGLELATDELPDYLPVLLECAELVRGGAALLQGHRPALELLSRALDEQRSPYADALRAVRARLGRASRGVLAKARRLAAAGPPREEVGLEPFAPPEVMTRTGGCR